MKGRKPISLSAESSKPIEDGGILTGKNDVGAMRPLDSPVNAQAPSEHLQLAAEGKNKRPWLEEGFYELEAIRKKRLQQGKVQYLIKWRGWPESANTWEPHENLSSCPDVVAAFERRSRAHSGKRSRCGRKRKLSATLTRTEAGLHHSAAAAKVTLQAKTRRRQHASAPAAEGTMGIETRNMPCHSSAAAKDNVPATKGIPLVAVPFPCLDDSSIENHVSNDVSRPKVSGSSRARNEHPLKTNGSSLEKSIADSEGTQILGACFPPGFSKSNIGKPVRSGRCARSAPRAIRKKVGSARKFTGNSSAHTSDDTQNPIRTTCSNMTAFGKDGFENVTINEIIRALSYQASVGRGVLTFEAKRSDGKVVRVTNDFLRANNPFLLLNFYDTYFCNTPAAGMQGSGNR
ncbi:PREDICTED: chromo domain protein LHP1-like isoform X3 [Ipomoea nil]|uniref:chromo domain protein LHP1-like isoform X3 n=1 Tax=Ipomoea nil TaxID=35883 RepID=UPI00090143F0|nr:PREDICTED: chromo domain protein LHP1-like isoform X3 [Ipomoea nil]